MAGKAHILVVPDLDAGNMLAKQFEYISHATLAEIVLGARIPIILTGRANKIASARLASSAIALLYADARRRASTVAAA